MASEKGEKSSRKRSRSSTKSSDSSKPTPVAAAPPPPPPVAQKTSASASKKAKKSKPSSKHAGVTFDAIVKTEVSPKIDHVFDPTKFNGWSTDDVSTLITNVSKLLARNDTVKYSTSVEKIDWKKVAFNKHSADTCKKQWIAVQLRLRRYRTLTDMVNDAKLWVKQPWRSFSNSKKVKHPDMPKKPLTPFFRYFMEKRQKKSKGHPALSVTELAKELSSQFAALAEKKKQKYKDAYDKEYAEYKDRMKAFREEHPELNVMFAKTVSGKVKEGPPKAHSPFELYKTEKLAKDGTASTVVLRKAAVDAIRKSWANLSDGKKIKWIRKSLQEEEVYKKELGEYKKTHPAYIMPLTTKTVLTKSEKELKDKYDGKPERPPNSGYSLFSKLMLKQLKDVPSKEKMIQIASRWKELNEMERDQYNRDAQVAVTKYVSKFESYLKSLPEDERARACADNKVKLPSASRLKKLEEQAKKKQQQQIAAAATAKEVSDEDEDDEESDDDEEEDEDAAAESGSGEEAEEESSADEEEDEEESSEDE